MVAALFVGLAETVVDTFGATEAVTYAAAGTPPIEIKAVVLRRPFIALADDSAGVEADVLTMHVLTSDVPAPARGDAVTIAGAAYRVGRTDPHPTGLTVLTLVEA